MSPVRTTILAAVLLSLPVAPTAAQAVFEGAITYRMTSEGRSVDATFMSKGTRTRMEMESPGMPGMMVVLMDNTAMVMQVVMQSMGMYLEMDMKKAAGSGTGTATAPRIDKAGTSDEIAGIRCENYRMKNGDEPEVESCIATGMGYFMGGMDNPMGGRGRGNAGPNWAAYSRHFPDGMLPLRVRMQRGGSWVTIMEAVSVVKKSLEDSLFRLPDGLRKMPMPGGQ